PREPDARQRPIEQDGCASHEARGLEQRDQEDQDRDLRDEDQGRAETADEPVADKALEGAWPRIVKERRHEAGERTLAVLDETHEGIRAPEEELEEHEDDEGEDRQPEDAVEDDAVDLIREALARGLRGGLVVGDAPHELR